jgi:hypothetical protein
MTRNLRDVTRHDFHQTTKFISGQNAGSIAHKEKRRYSGALHLLLTSHNRSFNWPESNENKDKDNLMIECTIEPLMGQTKRRTLTENMESDINRSREASASQKGRQLRGT